jgi:hypothetical protein
MVFLYARRAIMWAGDHDPRTVASMQSREVDGTPGPAETAGRYSMLAVTAFLGQVPRMNASSNGQIIHAARP